jgi:glucuronokinase
MDENFDLRASIYPITERNRQMVQIGRSMGAHVKFSGSGGAVIGVMEDEDRYPAIEKAYVSAGFKIFRPRIV